ncbi:hypothetical protein D9M72_482780 [compost metagenome]
MLRRCIAHQGTRNRFIDGSCDGGNDVRQREGGDRLRQSEPRQRQPGHEKRCGQHPFSADAIGQRAGKGADDCAEQRAGADESADACGAEAKITLQADREEGQAHALRDRHHAGTRDEKQRNTATRFFGISIHHGHLQAGSARFPWECRATGVGKKTPFAITSVACTRQVGSYPAAICPCRLRASVSHSAVV